MGLCLLGGVVADIIKASLRALCLATWNLANFFYTQRIAAF